MSVIRSRDVTENSKSEEPVEVITVEVTDGPNEFLPEESTVSAHEKGGSKGEEDSLGLFLTEGSGELECVVEADGSRPSSTENQAVTHGEATEPTPGVPGRYLTAARALALLVAFCTVVGGMAVTRWLTTPPVAQQSAVTGRPVSLLAPADSPVPAERRPSPVDPNAASEAAVGATPLPSIADLPATSTAGSGAVVAEGARDRSLRSEASEVLERVIRRSASEPVSSLRQVPAPAPAREQVEPVPRLLAALPMAAADRIAVSPPAATQPDIRRPEPPSRPVELQRDVEDGAIRVVLGRYLFASNHLDPAAVRDVWPTADLNALERAFDQLESHEIGFDDCSIVISGAQARADCRGTLSYIPRIGQKRQRVEPRQWRIDLHKVDANWLIAAVAAR